MHRLEFSASSSPWKALSNPIRISHIEFINADVFLILTEISPDHGSDVGEKEFCSINRICDIANSKTIRKRIRR